MTSQYDPRTHRTLVFHDRRAAFLDGSDSPRAYLERCLEVIATREPTVRAWVTLNVDGARAAADAASARWRAGQPCSPIDGMPAGIKDLFMTRDMPTKMGSPLYEENFPRQDSACVQALRAAGAVILGKTVTTELGMSHPGPTTNPFHPEHTPGGSSSGSAAAVGAGMVPVAIGSQVIGSVIRPAGFCGNIALKPTLGAIHRGERQGFSQSHVGIHANDLRDMWQVAWEVARRAGGDPGHFALSGGPDPHAPLQPDRLIVVESEGWAMLEADTRTAFEALLARVAAAGTVLVRRSDDAVVEAFERAIGDSLRLCRDICGYELRWTLENLLAQHGGGLSDSLMTRLDMGRAMQPEDYHAALVLRAAARAALQATAASGAAMISLSSVGPAPRMDNRAVDSGVVHTTGLPAFNAWTSVLGAPAITLPLLALRGLPVGVQLVGRAGEDHRLTGHAAWLRDLALSGK